MASTTNDIDYKNNVFELPKLTKIYGEPNTATLVALRNEVRLNAQSVFTVLGGGKYGHLGLVMNDALYLKLPETVPYVRPTYPGHFRLGSQDLTNSQIAERKATWEEETRLFREVEAIERNLTQQIVVAVEDKYIKALRSPFTGKITTNVKGILNHLFKCYGKTPLSAVTIPKRKVKDFELDQVDSIDSLLEEIDDLADVSTSQKNESSEKQLMEMAYKIVEETRKLKTGLRDWNEKSHKKKPALQEKTTRICHIEQDKDKCFLSLVRNRLGVPASCLDTINENELRNIPQDERDNFVSLIESNLIMNPSYQSNKTNKRYLYTCIKNLKNEAENRKNSSREPLEATCVSESNVDKNYAIHDMTIGNYAKESQTPHTPDMNEMNCKIKSITNPYKVRNCHTVPSNSHHQSKSMAQPEGRMKPRNLSLSFSIKTTSPTIHQSKKKLTNPYKKSNQQQMDSTVRNEKYSQGQQLYPEKTKDVFISEEDFDNEFISTPSTSIYPNSNDGTHRFGLHSSKLNTSDGFPLKFIIEMYRNKLNRRLDILNYLDSISENMHIHHSEKFIVFLQQKIVTSYENIELEEIQKNYNEITKQRVPLHDKICCDDLNLPIDDWILRERRENIQYYAKVEFNRDGPYLKPYLIKQEKLSNRVLRHFWEYRDRFLSVYIDKEIKQSSQKIVQLIKFFDEKGKCNFLGRQYEFLYEHDAKIHLFAPVNINAKTTSTKLPPIPVQKSLNIINWIGDMSKVKETKRGDRISLAFTPTTFIATLKRDNITIQKDTLSSCKQYCFTDGVGSYGPDIQTIIVNNFNNKNVCFPICAAQIRIGSAKGLIVNDPHIKGLHLRESMLKFVSSRLELEIVEVNRTAYVNNLDSIGDDESIGSGLMRMNVDIIQQLEYGGVPLEVMNNMLHTQLNNLRDAFQSPKIMRKVLKSKLVFDETNGRFDHVEEALAGNMDMNKYPLRDWIENRLMENHIQKLIKLQIPLELGASNLFGCTLDSSLQPNQIFVKLTPSSDPLTGKVVIGRHPCNHPGDIQVVEATTSNDLSNRLGHLHGLVVFPISGSRPIPDMLGGGDLDGDKYWIIFDPKLIPPKNENPLDYGTYSPKTFSAASLGLYGHIKEGNMDSESYRKMIEQSIQNQCKVGFLTNLRKLAADKFGAKDDRTVELCKLVSIAHDAKTTGVDVLIPSSLRHEILCTGYPCWWQETITNKFVKRYSPRDAVGKAAASLFNIVKGFEFNFSPIELDPYLCNPNFDLNDYDDTLHVQKIIGEFYHKKYRLVCDIKEKSEFDHLSFGYQTKSKDTTTDDGFKALEDEALHNLLRIEPNQLHGSVMNVDRLKQRVTALYLLSYNRRPQGNNYSTVSSSILQIRVIMQYLVQMKKEALDNEMLAKGLVPHASLLLTQPEEFRITRKK